MGDAELAMVNAFCLRLPQFSVMQVDDHEAEEYQRFDECEAENQGRLNAVVSARIAGHAFTCRGRDATLANAAQSRRYSEAYSCADVAKPFAQTRALGAAASRLLRKSGHRRKEHSRQSEAKTNQVTFHCFLL